MADQDCDLCGGLGIFTDAEGNEELCLCVVTDKAESRGESLMELA